MSRPLAALLALLLAGSLPLAAADAAPPLPFPAEGEAPVRELRLAVVCYGGVSLAIYMFGQTRELHHLALASTALECDAQGTGSPAAAIACGSLTPGQGWDALPASARPYYEALVDDWTERKVRTRVVVDIVAGTSAGGINGILLAKALAQGTRLDPLRKLWFEQADIGKLATGRPWAFHAAWRLIRGKPALDGKSWLKELHKALGLMDGAPSGFPSLLAPEQSLDLLVTATDFYGSERLLEIGDPPSSWENRHDHVFRFAAARKPDGRVAPSDFGPDSNGALAFAARASASFPVAFPAIRLADLEGLEPAPDTAELARRLFREQLAEKTDRDAGARQLAEELFLVDGGVLNNYPIGLAFRAVSGRTPRMETRRVLVYLEPDPRLLPEAEGSPDGPPRGQQEAPHALRMLLAGKSGIPGAQPIADDLLEIGRHNQRVARILDIVRQDEDEARADRGRPADAPPESVAARVEAALGLQRGDLARPRELEGKMPGPSSAGAGAESEPGPDEPSDPARQQIRDIRRQLEQRAGGGLPEMEEAYRRLRVQSVLDQLARNLGTVVCRLPDGHEGPRASVLRALVFDWASENGYLGDALTPARRDELLHAYDLGYLRRNLRFVDDWLSIQYDPARSNAEEKAQDVLMREAHGYGLQREQVQAARLAIARQIDRITEIIRGKGLDDPRLAAEMERTAAAVCGTVDTSRTAAEHAAALHGRGLLEPLERELRRVLLSFQEKVLADLYADFVRETSTWRSPDAARAVLARYLGFPFWDRVAYPYTAFSGTGDLARIEVMRFSPNDVTSLSARRAAKLSGTSLGHFGAFFSEDGRQRDYVWGRFDGAERILTLLGRPQEGSRLGGLQHAIVEDERRAGEVSKDNLRHMEACVLRPSSC